MDRLQKRHLNDIKKHLDYEEMKLRKQAGNLRRSTKKGKGGGPERPIRDDNWEEIVDAQEVGRLKSRGTRPTLGDVIDELRKAPGAQAFTAREGDRTGIVISVASGRCRVVIGEDEVDCSLPPELATAQKSLLAVGDRVSVDDERRVQGVLPRRTVLSRPDPINAHRQRLIAANIDVVVHVVSLKAPPLRPRLIDRYLIAIQRGGAQPVLCVNKADLVSAEERVGLLAQLEPYRELGVPVIVCSTQSGEGIDALRAEVEGKVCALVGHSGVGKSSILNALDSRLELATNTLHRRGTGRHTTTSSALYDFGGGTYLIDTPGIREFGLWDLTLETLRDYFPELEEAAEYCRFNDCTHLHEPGCEVKERVERGEIRRARYDTYVRLANDLSSQGG